MNRRTYAWLLPLTLPVALVAGILAGAPAALATGAGTTHAGPAPITPAQRTAALRATAVPMLAQIRAAQAAPAAGAGARTAVPSSRVVVPHHSQAFLAALRTPTLVFTRYNDTLTFGLESKNLLTGALSMLIPLNSTICPLSPRMSPDGTTVAFVDYGAGCNGDGVLDVLDVASATITQLVTAQASTFLLLPSWNPASTKILYTLEQDDANGFVNSSLFTEPIGGGSPTPVSNGGLNAYGGVWSPDGTKIAYAPTVPITNSALAVMNADGTGSSTLTHTAINATYWPIHPAWSPDGAKVSFTYVKSQGIDRSGKPFFINGIGVAATDDSSGGPLTVTSSSQVNAYYSSWSADGTEIFYDALLRDTVHGDNLGNANEYATDAGGHRRATLVASTLDAYDGVDFSGDSPSTGSASTYTPIPPVRVLAKTPVGAGAFVDVPVAGTNGIPANATAVTLNLTGVSPSLSTYLQAYPAPDSGTAFPTVSNLNLVPGQICAVAVQVSLPASGTGIVRVRNNAGTTGVIVDVSGYFTGGTTNAAYSPITPVRALDGTLGQGGVTDIDVGSLNTVPGLTPVAVVLNLTAANPSHDTYLAAYPTPAGGVGPVPTVSNLNLTARATRANLVTVQIGDAGRVRVRNAFGSVRTVVDVLGFYGSGASGGLAYYALPPTRFMDTRNGTNTWVGSTAPLGSNVTLPIDMRGSATTSSAMITVPATALAYVYNLTAVAPTGNTYLSAYPYGGTRPLSSSVNAPPGKVVPNLVITSTDPSGQIALYNRTGSTPFIIDLAGYYAP